ncbi:hypothetical protein M569_12174, partial [Genlisea aurea]
VVGGTERFVHKGISANLVIYLTEVIGLSNSSAARYVNTWVGFTSMLPLIVATAADSCCRNRNSAILAFALPYVAGLLALTSRSLRRTAAAAKAKAKPASLSSLSWSLYMISLGQAGYNPSLQAFGAEQLHGDAGKRHFFQWWYLGICSGSLLGVSIMSYIQDTFGWGLGFAIPTVFMITSVAMFLLGNKLFNHDDDAGTSLPEIFRDIRRGISKILSGCGGGCCCCLVSDADDDVQEEVSAIEEEDKEKRQQQQQEDTLKLQHMGEVVLRLFPIWVSLLMFAVIYQQPATFFTKQGMTMNRTIAGGRFKIPPAALQSAITISIIVLMPLYDKLFVPLARLLTRDENGVSVEQRMSVGMIFAVASMAVAAAVEKRRLSKIETPMTIAWLLPQYVLLGISDVFTVVGMQEFFYGEVPEGMRTVGIALYTSVFGFGSLLGAILITVIEWLTKDEGGGGGWFSDDDTRLDKYYWLLGSASFFSFIAFLIF